MNIQKELEGELSGDDYKRRAVAVADAIGNDQKIFDELMSLFLGSDTRVAQRSAWAVIYCVQRNPGLLDSHLEELILTLKSDCSDAIKRNTVRLLQYVDIPDVLAGSVADLCFCFLNNNKETIAVKAFSMTVLHNLTRRYPELGQELVLIIEGMLPYGSPGIRSRGLKILKVLRRNRALPFKQFP